MRRFVCFVWAAVGLMMWVLCVETARGDGLGERHGVVRGDLCEPEWVEGFGMPGLSGNVEALAVFDDGNGPALYAGGYLPQSGGNPGNHIVRWDGSGWSPLGAGVNAPVLALTVFDDGSGPALYVGGSFTQAGGIPANGIARWDGSGWSALEGPTKNGVNGIVRAFAVVDGGTIGPALYVGGNFTEAGGVGANRIARWNGAEWSGLVGQSGNGLNGAVNALTVFDDGSGPALYVGGDFTNAGGVQANRIARWDGTDGLAWSALIGPSGNGVSSTVFSLSMFDDGTTGDVLFVGGSFITAGGLLANRIARWDGSAWFSLVGDAGVGVNGAVLGMTVFDDGGGPALYVGGDYTAAGGLQVNKIGRWNGTEWSGLGTAGGIGVQGTVQSLTKFDEGSFPSLFIGGSIFFAGGFVADRIAQWRGCAAEPVPCVGDLNGDGVVDADDLGVLLGAFGSSAAGDLNRDGVTDADDLGILLGVFGSACE